MWFDKVDFNEPDACLSGYFDKKIEETRQKYLEENPFNTRQMELPEVSESEKKLYLTYKHGTTTLGFRTKAGIFLAADSRATMGNYIATNETNKIWPINDYICGTIAGGAADAAYFLLLTRTLCRQRELQENEDITATVATKILVDMLYRYRKSGLSLGTIMGGKDYPDPKLFYVDNSGLRIEGDHFSCGSGSMFAYGVLDSQYSYDLTFDQSVELAKRAIAHAAHRDAMSGGFCRVWHITNQGYKVIVEGQDVNEILKQYKSGELVQAPEKVC